MSRVKNKTENVDNFLSYDINVDDRIIHIVEKINPEVVSKYIKGIQLMLIKDKEKPIDIYINSYGGEVYSGLGLYNYVRSLEGIIVRTYNIGSCMSIASIIFLAGDERYMYEDTVFMLHSASTDIDGKKYTIVSEAEEMKKIHIQMSNIYGDRTKKDSKYWHKALEFKDIYVRSEEALELGIINKIIK